MKRPPLRNDMQPQRGLAFLGHFAPPTACLDWRDAAHLVGLVAGMLPVGGNFSSAQLLRKSSHGGAQRGKCLGF